MTEEGTVAWGGYAWGTLTPKQTEAWDGPKNYTIPEIIPWGSQGLVAAMSIIFAIWIVLTNGFLLVVLFKSRTLRTQWITPFIVHMVLADLAVGVFYCPLSADFYIKQVWTHGCESLLIWNNFFFFSTFLSVHSLGVLDIYRLLQGCCRMRLNRKLEVVITVVLLFLLWIYLIFFYLAVVVGRMPSQQVITHGGTTCEPYPDAQGGILLSMLSYLFPAPVIVVLLIIILIRETCISPAGNRPGEDSNKVLSFKVIAAANVITLGMCAPSLLATSSVLQAGCGTFACANSKFLVATIFEWILFAKSGIQPIVWLLDSDCKRVLMTMIGLSKKSEKSRKCQMTSQRTCENYGP